VNPVSAEFPRRRGGTSQRRRWQSLKPTFRAGTFGSPRTARSTKNFGLEPWNPAIEADLGYHSRLGNKTLANQQTTIALCRQGKAGRPAKLASRLKFTVTKVLLPQEALKVNIFEDRYALARTGLRGSVARYRCETVESSGIQRIDTATYDQTGRLQEGTHQLAGPVIRRTFGYDGSLLVEEKIYSDGRLKSVLAHSYDGDCPSVSRSYDEVGTLAEEHRYEFHHLEGVGTAVSLDYGRVSDSAQAFRMATSSVYLRLHRVTAERRLISPLGQILARYLLDQPGLVRGFGSAIYDEKNQVVSERLFVGSSVFSNVLTMPEGMKEMALVRHEYTACNRYRTDTLEQEGRVTITTTEFDSYGNPMRKSQTNDANRPYENQDLVTILVYDYDKHKNWVKQVITDHSKGLSTPYIVTSTREIEYY